jgi:hypothetical protein
MMSHLVAVFLTVTNPTIQLPSASAIPHEDQIPLPPQPPLNLPERLPIQIQNKPENKNANSKSRRKHRRTQRQFA